MKPAASLWWGPPVDQTFHWPPGYRPANTIDMSNPGSPAAVSVLNSLSTAQSTLSLLPPIHQSSLAEATRNSLYRKSNTSINDLRRSNRMNRHKAGGSQALLPPALRRQTVLGSGNSDRPKSAYAPLRKDGDSGSDHELGR